MAAPLVSVLIPTYNGADFVAETIGSVLGQTFCDFELIVGDDGSSDATVEIARAVTWATTARRCSSTTATSAASTASTALRLARGRYVKYLLQDDLMTRRDRDVRAALEADPGSCSPPRAGG